MSNQKSVLVTGGAGYIGSHICVALVAAGFTPVIVDDLSNAHESVVDRIATISGVKPVLYHLDSRDAVALKEICIRHEIMAVIHLAAKKAVAESVAKPLDYYACNIDSLLAVLGVMNDLGIAPIVYSSSATVYAPMAHGKYGEDDALGPVNPYGWTKFMGEQIVTDTAATSGIRGALLRYFNPVGAHPSGLIGESPKGTPNNLMPLLCEVVAGTRPQITVFGDDYDTPDGTAIRDYVHVMDVAEAHIAALKKLVEGGQGFTLNIGTGYGCSVLEIIKTYERVNGVTVAHTIGPRRPGDAAHVCAITTKATEFLGWSSSRGLDEMCADLHRWATRAGK